MSKYEYPDLNDSPSKPSGRSPLELWDLLSILVILMTACLGIYFVLIFVSPFSDLNPLQPIDPNAPPTPTITEIILEPTWTASVTIEPTITDTPPPTITLEPSPTLFSMITPSITFTPSVTPTITTTPKAPFSATVDYYDSKVIHPETTCNWLGVGGTIVDANNSDVTGMVVRLVGNFNGKRVEMTTVSGVFPAYGKSGFEFFLGAEPVSSNDELYLQLLDQAGLPLSDNVYIDTFTDCAKNLALVRFKKNR